MQAGGLTVFILASWLLVISSLPASATSEQDYPLEIVLSEMPPLVMKGDGKPTGLLSELSFEIMKRTEEISRARFTRPPRIQPWPRAYRMLKMGAGKIMLQMAKLPAREKLFSWIRPLMPLRFAFVSMGDKPVLSLEEARKQGRIGVYRKSQVEAFLRNRGFTSDELVLGKNSDQNYKLLRHGRVSSWLAFEDEAHWMAQQDVIKPKITVGKPILESQIWLVTSKDVPSDIQDVLKSVTESIFTDGTFEKLCEKYMLKYKHHN
jgi:polar amino acid transport system substrate-binding protein